MQFYQSHHGNIFKCYKTHRCASTQIHALKHADIHIQTHKCAHIYMYSHKHVHIYTCINTFFSFISSVEVISKGYFWFILQVGKMLLNLRKILSKYYIFEKSLHYYAHRDQHILYVKINLVDYATKVNIINCFYYYSIEVIVIKF